HAPDTEEFGMAVPTRSEVEALIAERISADPSFREVLLADPRGVVAEIVDVDLPDNVQVVLHEESLTQIHLIIPSAEDLSDADLELVAGGGNCWSNTSGGETCH
ncbi:MAG: NHLP leader peptide family RiPP precursor, partial [Actinomycetota bacterium]